MFKNRYIKLGIIYSALTLLFCGLIFVFGLKIAVFVSELFQKNKSLPISSISENVLPSPQFDALIEATNSAVLPISGYSQPNEKVDIYLNDLNVKTLEVNSGGTFSYELFLALGINKIYAVTKDLNNQQSSPSRQWTVYFQDSPPNLEITEPENNSSFKKVSDIIIKGKADSGTDVLINDHQVVMENDGSFSYPIKLQNGENKFKIVCVDPAQNSTQIDWTLNFQP